VVIGGANAMDGDTIMYIVWGVVLLGILISIFIAYWSRRHRAKRLQLMDLFSGYFRGDMPADQLGARARQIVSRHFMGSAQFFSLAVAAFQSAVDARLAHQPHSEERQKKLLRMLAALKNEFGLTDRYQIEGWRTGRE
jgi:hypothetical protein